MAESALTGSVFVAPAVCVAVGRLFGINATYKLLYLLNPVVPRLWKNPCGKPPRPAVENLNLRHHQWFVNAVVATNRLWKNLWKTCHLPATLPVENDTDTNYDQREFVLIWGECMEGVL